MFFSMPTQTKEQGTTFVAMLHGSIRRNGAKKPIEWTAEAAITRNYIVCRQYNVRSLNRISKKCWTRENRKMMYRYGCAHFAISVCIRRGFPAVANGSFSFSTIIFVLNFFIERDSIRLAIYSSPFHSWISAKLQSDDMSTIKGKSFFLYWSIFERLIHDDSSGFCVLIIIISESFYAFVRFSKLKKGKHIYTLFPSLLLYRVLLSVLPWQTEGNQKLVSSIRLWKFQSGLYTIALIVSRLLFIIMLYILSHSLAVSINWQSLFNSDVQPAPCTST